MTLTEIVRDGQMATDGNRRFFIDTFSFDLFFPAINDRGQIGFEARLVDTPGGSQDNNGIFFYDDALGLVKVARKGDPFLGSTFDGFDLTLATLPPSPELTGLNNRGQVAFKFKLVDGRQGIALWSAPTADMTSRLDARYDADLRVVIISWSSALTGWTLQTTMNPADAQSWMNVLTAPTAIENEFQVALSIEPAHRFFRLRSLASP